MNPPPLPLTVAMPLGVPPLVFLPCTKLTTALVSVEPQPRDLPALADGSASFVGIERVTGTVGGRQETFLLQDAGTVAGNIVSGDWFVIPGSGSRKLQPPKQELVLVKSHM